MQLHETVPAKAQFHGSTTGLYGYMTRIWIILGLSQLAVSV